MTTMYTAFLSSAYESLRAERQTVIDFLLDGEIMPFCMEHFTVSTDEQFKDIEKLIDASDYFVLLLGVEYGSCDKKGTSWTEREYKYALKKKKPILGIICDDLTRNLALSDSEISKLPSSQQAQIAFVRKNGAAFLRATNETLDITRILNQFFSNSSIRSRAVGWTRSDHADDEKKRSKWRKEHKQWDLGGTWYHFHLSNIDKTYIRVGTVKIKQDFSPDKYQELELHGKNNSVEYYDVNAKKLHENELESSEFDGCYTMDDNGKITGIYRSHRTFDGTFDNKEVEKKENRGIHDFSLEIGDNAEIKITGEFHDIAPSRKHGRLFLFRSAEVRDRYLLKFCGEYIKQV